MKKELIFDVKINDGGADATVKSVSGEVKTLGKEAKETAKDTLKLSDALTQAKDALYELARQSKTDTKEFQDLKDEASRLENVMKSVDATISATATSGKGLSAALEVGSAVTAGYGAVQGGMALMGVESEKLMEMMTKLQGAQAILNSLEQAKILLDGQSIVMTKLKSVATAVWAKVTTTATAVTNGATIATRALNAAMLAMPILLIVAGIVALISWLIKLSNENESVAESNEAITKSYERMTEAMETSSRIAKREHDNKMALMKSEGAGREELFALELEGMERLEIERKKSIKLEQETIGERQKLYRRALENGNDEEAIKIKEQIQASRDKYKQLKELDGQYFVDKKVAENNYNAESAKLEAEAQKKIEDKQKEANSRWKANQEKKAQEEEKARLLKIERERLMQDLINENIVNADDRQRAIMMTKFAREQEDLKAKFVNDTALLKQLTDKQNAELSAYEKQLKDEKSEKEKERIAKEQEQANIDAKAYLESKLINEREDLEAMAELRAEMALLEYEQALQNKELTDGELLRLDAEYKQKLADLDAEDEERKKALREKNIQATIEGYNALVSSLGSLSDAMYQSQLNNVEKGSAQELEIRKKQFETNKKLQIAQAIMQGYQAVMAAYSSGSAIPIVGAVMGPVYAGLAGIASLVQINNIRKQKFDGGGGSISAPPSVSMPTVPPNPYMNDGQSTDGLEGSGAPKETPSIKVNIVDSEIKAKMDNSEKVNVLSNL